MAKYIDKALDIEWSKAIKRQANNMCEICGSPSDLEAHHVFTRNNKSTRWELSNGVCLCEDHHKNNPKLSAHRTEIKFKSIMADKRGVLWMEQLEWQTHQLAKFTKEDKKEMLRELKAA